MKNRMTTLLGLAALLLSSCSDSGDDSFEPVTDPLEQLNLIHQITANGHQIELYSEKESLQVGYNEVFFRVYDEATKAYLPDLSLSWMPVMHMTDRMHSCPKEDPVPTEDPGVLRGFAIFQMPGNPDEYWEFTFNYKAGGQEFTATESLEVTLAGDGLKTLNVFTGSDQQRYVLALQPFEPEVAVNPVEARLFRMESMMNFVPVPGYTVTLDPRMPGMGNHGSPNNEDFSYDAASGLYQGALSLTMNGYWKINLKLLGASGEWLAGEDVTEETESSSLYFEVEF